MGMSALAFAAGGLFIEGLIIVGAGTVIAVAGVVWHHAKT
jgi:hypothetical protein